jgi:hypothetical protein
MLRLAVLVPLIAAGCRGESASQRTAATEDRPAAPPPAMPADATPASDELRPVRQTESALDSSPTDEGRRRLDAMDKATLVSLARHGACRWAVLAAYVLERRGDAAFLPRRGAANTPAELSRLLCMIANLPTRDERGDSIPTRQQEFLRDFLPPRGEVTTSREECDDGGKPVEGTFTRADATGDELDPSFGANQLLDCVAGTPPGSFSCSGVGPTGRSADVTLSPDQDGRLYLRAIAVSRPGVCH